jgi:hypothetical protein
MSDRPILSFDPARTTNALAIVDAAALGFLDGHVLDLTLGPEAGFWSKWRPAVLTTNDLDTTVPADLHHDARAVPLPDATFDAVVYDPPYGYRGTSRLASDRRYGLAGPYRTADEIDGLLVAGTLEALRLARRYVLAKCEDQNVSGRYRPQTTILAGAVLEHGHRVVAELHVVGGYRPQPAGKRQVNVWHGHSTLVVLAPRRRRPTSRRTPGRGEPPSRPLGTVLAHPGRSGDVLAAAAPGRVRPR